MTNPPPIQSEVQVTLVAVQSLDGCITRRKEPGIGFASEADQLWFRSILKQFDAIIMGRKTYEPVRAHIAGSMEGGSKTLRIVLTRSPADWEAAHRPGHLEFDGRPPRDILADLATRGYGKVILLGGSTVNRLFLEAGLVDQMWLTLEPEIFGEGLRLVDGPVDARFHLEGTEKLGGSTLLLRYARKESTD